MADNSLIFKYKGDAFELVPQRAILDIHRGTCPVVFADSVFPALTKFYVALFAASSTRSQSLHRILNRKTSP